MKKDKYEIVDNVEGLQKALAEVKEAPGLSGGGGGKRPRARCVSAGAGRAAVFPL